MPKKYTVDHGDGFRVNNQTYGFVEGTAMKLTCNFFNRGELQRLNECFKRRGITGRKRKFK